MNDVSDRELFALAADALDPGRRVAVEEELGASAALRARYALVVQRLVVARAAPRPWTLPPPALAGLAAFRATAAPPTDLMGAPRVEPGGWFPVYLEVLHPSAHQVVVLRKVGGAWSVVFPAHPDDVARVDELPREPDGRWRLDLSAGPEAGTQRWAVALPPAEAPVDWEAPAEARWTWLREALDDDPTGVVVVDVEVG